MVGGDHNFGRYMAQGAALNCNLQIWLHTTQLGFAAQGSIDFFELLSEAR